MWEEILELDKEVKYVILRDSKRNFTTAQIARALKKQGYIDPVDGLPLNLNDAIGGHNVAWSKGGLTILDNCIAIRKEYNDDMGTKTLDEYKEEKELALQNQLYLYVLVTQQHSQNLKKTREMEVGLINGVTERFETD